MTIHWDRKFEVGHPRIDAEHQIFLSLIHELGARIEGKAPSASLGRILAEVQHYAAFHFVSEENLMEEMNYPATEEHRQLHKMLMASLQDKNRQVMQGKLACDELLDFLLDWFAIHTTQEDRKLTRHIESLGQGGGFNPFAGWVP